MDTTTLANPASAKGATKPKAVPSLVEQEIVERVFSAVMEHRLPAGTKLSEIALSETFRASRARIRRALLMLAERDIVELHSNRGAFVACPSPEDARDIFQARRTVEPTVVENAVQRITEVQLAILERDAAWEIAAAEAGKRHEAIRLSGQFHVKLAEFAGNQVLTRFLEDLVARTSLIIGLFGSSRISSCARKDHGALIRAIAARDTVLATSLMVDHLNHIESELELKETNDKPVDIREILKI